MTSHRHGWVLATLLLPLALQAQSKPSGSGGAGSAPRAPRAEVLTQFRGFGPPLSPAAGTRLSSARSWEGAPCAGAGCVVAQNLNGPPGVTLQFGDGSVHGVRTTLRVEHGQAHAVAVALDGSEVMGFSCDGHLIRLLAPGGGAFRWATYRGAQRTGGGTSSGAAVEVAAPAHAGPGGGPMQVSVQQRDPGQLAGADDAWCKKYGCLQLALVHGDDRIVVMPVLDRVTPFPLRTLTLRVSGVPAFAVSGVETSR